MRLTLPKQPPATVSPNVLIGLCCVLLGVGVGVACSVINPLYLLALLPVLAVGAWALADARRGLWLMILVIAIVPRVASPVSVGFKPTLLDAAMIATLLAWLLWRKKNAPSVHTPLLIPLLILITVTITTFVLGVPNGALTTLVLRRFGELIISLIMVLVLISIFRQNDVLSAATRLMLVGGAIAALIGMVLYIIPGDLTIRILNALRPFGYPTGDGVLRFVRDDPSLLKRATGLWIDPNAFGGYLLMIGAIGLPQLFAARPVMKRMWVWLCVGCIGLGMVLTISRSAMLGFAFAAIIIGLFKQRRLLGLIAVAFVAMLVLPQTRELIGHFLDGFAGRDLATQMRFGEYKDAFRLIERYPFFGVGFINSPDVDLYIGVSSVYLLIAQQIGLIGLTAYLIVIITFFVSAIRTAKYIWHDEQRVNIWLGAHAAVLGAMLSGIFDHYFFNIDFHNSVMLFWLIVAMGASCYRPREIEQ
jgi:hypothetical protein